MTTKLELIISSRRLITPLICQFEFRRPEGGALPRFEAGAHIEVETPSGATRNYSLTNDELETDRYVIAVKREGNSRGGSLGMHEAAREGDRLMVASPRNILRVIPARKYLLIAGGIGITPILSIFRKLVRERHDHFNLVYSARSPEETAYLEELSAPQLRERVTIHHSARNGSRYDFWERFRSPDDTHIYFCGPEAMMDGIEAQTVHWPRSAIHSERFSAVAALGIPNAPFRVRRAGAEESYDIPADRSVLQVFRDAGLKPRSSCESGACGTCRVRLVKGEAEHRDVYLTAEERKAYFMPCVSRAASEELTLEF